MHNIEYVNGVVESELLKIVNLHKPFHSKVDKFSRKASLSKLVLSPDETRNSLQIKRFVLPINKRYAYKMHVTYKDSIKCHNIYKTNSSVDKTLRVSLIKHLVENIHIYPEIKKDILSVVKVLLKAWTFDCVITDIPWISKAVSVPVIVPHWKLINYNTNLPYENAVNLLLKKYKTIPLNILPYECLRNLPKSCTDISDIAYKCPLVLMKTNSYFSGYVVNCMSKGLPTTLFKIN